jgi:hypothetical protein
MWGDLLNISSGYGNFTATTGPHLLLEWESLLVTFKAEAYLGLS